MCVCVCFVLMFSGNNIIRSFERELFGGYLSYQAATVQIKVLHIFLLEIKINNTGIGLKLREFLTGNSEDYLQET